MEKKEREMNMPSLLMSFILKLANHGRVLVSPGCHLVMTFIGRFHRIQLKIISYRDTVGTILLFGFLMNGIKKNIILRFCTHRQKFELNSAHSQIFIHYRWNIKSSTKNEKGKSKSLFPSLFSLFLFAFTDLLL